MADLRRTIEIIFNGVDNVSDEIGDIDNSIGGFAGSIESATQPLADLSKNILQVEAALGALGVALLTYTASVSIDFEAAQAGLQKVLGDSEGSVADYTNTLDNLSLQFGVAGDSTLDAVTNFKQAGFSINESLTLTETALTAVKIAELESNEAAGLLVATIKGLGLEAEDATHILDAWNEVSNKNAATAKELAIATSSLAPVARNAGLSFNEAVGLVTPIIEVFGSGSEAANALKTGLANLISDTPKVTDSLAELGIAQQDANGELRLAGDILADLGAVWPTLTDSQKANFGIQLFGKEQYARMSATLNEYSKVVDVTSQAETAAGSAKKELASVTSTTKFAIEQFAAAFQLASKAVGDQFLPSINPAVKAMTSLTKSFAEVVKDGGLKPLFDLLNPLFDEFTKNIEKIAENLPEAFEGVDFNGLADSFRNLGGEVGDLFGGIDLTTAEGLQDFIQGIVDALAALNNTAAGILDGLSPVIDAIKAIATSAGSAENSTATFAGQLLGLGTTINVFSGWISGLTDVFSALSDALIIVLSVNALGGLPASLTNIAPAATNAISLLGKGGLVGAVGLLSYEVTKWAAEESGLTETLADWALELTGVNDDLRENQKILEDQARAAHENAAANLETKEVFEEQKQPIKETDTATESLIQTSDRYANLLEHMGLNLQGIKEEQEKLKDTVDDSVETFDNASDVNGAWIEIIKDGKVQFARYEDVVGKTKDTTKDLAKAEEEAANKAQKLATDALKAETALEKIASNERIKNLEFAVEFKTAQIEAETKRIEAAFESLTETTTASAGLIGELFGVLTSTDDRFKELEIESAIDKVQDLMKQQIDKQGELIDAQIAQLEAAAERMASGDALLTVDGGDLQPELQAIMESLFKSIRIEMSASYEDYLLGLGTI